MSNKNRHTRSSATTSTTDETPLPACPSQESATTLDFQSFVSKALTALTEKVDQIAKSTNQLVQDNEDLKSALEYTNQEVKDLTATAKSQAGDIAYLKTQLVAEERQSEALEKRLEQQFQRHLQLETYSRRSNLILEGVEEVEGENCTQAIIITLHSKFRITVNAADIDKAHRYGRAFGGKPRPLIVKFVSHTARDNILYAARSSKEKPPGIYVNEDLPSEVKTQRAELRAVANQARTAGARHVKLQGDKVTIDNKVYTHDSIKLLPPKYGLEAARTKKVNDKTIGFHSKYSYLSNFYHSQFVYDGVKFTSVEQMYQVKKAELAGRQDLVPIMLAETDSLRIKRLGDMIFTPRDDEWHKSKIDIMQTAVRVKFQQNPGLLQQLRETGQNTLVEATRDAFWGAGVPLTSVHLKTNTYSGENRLGKILMDIRDN